jgi:PEP-CTERM motif
MKRFILILTVLFIAAAARPMLAEPIPYPPSDGGHIAPTSVIKASSTGDVTGYYVNSGASDEDQVRLCDLTSNTCSNFFFDNQSTSAGATADFGSVTQGDTLVFELENLSLTNPVTNQPYIFASDPALSDDGVNHAYVTPYTDSSLGNGIPPGTYVGMEDEPASFSDFNYQDDDFVFTNVTATPAVPEPSSIALLGTGMFAIAGAVRRRFASR